MPRQTERKAVRQGDILIVPVKPGTANGRRVAPVNGRYIVAEGELTGHNHAVKATPHIAMLDNGINTFIEAAKRAAPLSHEEHTSLPISVGESEVVRQRTVRPGSEHSIVRVVAD